MRARDARGRFCKAAELVVEAAPVVEAVVEAVVELEHALEPVVEAVVEAAVELAPVVSRLRPGLGALSLLRRVGGR